MLNSIPQPKLRAVALWRQVPVAVMVRSLEMAHKIGANERILNLSLYDVLSDSIGISLNLAITSLSEEIVHFIDLCWDTNSAR
jgi:hypothetical protein